MTRPWSDVEEAYRVAHGLPPWPQTPEVNEWQSTMTGLLGRRVTVTIATEPKEVAVTGILQTFTDFGSVCVLDDESGEHIWAWPNLHIREH